MRPQFKEIWRRKNVEDLKLDIRVQLEEIERHAGVEAKLQYLLNEVQSLEDQTQPESLLRRFILVISTLYHHQKHGGLGKKQLNDLADLAEAILLVSGVKPGPSQISFLYAELHFVLSDIHLLNSEFLPALWEQQVGSQLAALTPDMKARRELGMGVYSMRLGNLELAIQFFENALSKTKEPLIQNKTRLHLVRALRLRGSFELAKERGSNYRRDAVDQSYLNEFTWEITCCEASETQNLEPLLNLCRKGSDFYLASYLLELFFWLRAHPKTQWIDRLPKLATLSQHQEINFRRYPHLYAIAQQLEAAYDTEVPFSTRLSNMKKILQKITLLRNIDKELLVWLAITRWLFRSRYSDIAGIIFYEYTSLCHKLSGGVNRDVLGLAHDLADVDWKSKIAD